MPTMKKVHALRLLKLANKLDHVSRKNFDMDWWCQENECGTTACALGWAGKMPEFRRAGLVSIPSQVMGAVSLNPRLACDVEAMAEYHSEMVARYGRGNYPINSEAAGQIFFGLSRDESSRIFYSAKENETGKQVAKRIRKLVKEHFPKLYLADLRKRAAAR